MEFKAVAHTDIGIRKDTNQDSAMIKIARTDYGDVAFCVVCDGMGGLSKGEVASANLIRAFEKWFLEEFPQMLYRGIDHSSLRRSWENQIYEINNRIAQYSDCNHVKMGTTIVALLIVGNVYYLLNVGDSRAYMLDHQLHQLTKDQTFIQREMDLGRMTWEEAKRDPRRNVLLQCVGASTYIEPDFYVGDVSENSIFMLCSDGFRHLITPDEIYEYLNPARLIDEQAMLDSAVYLVELNKYRNEDDNITIALIRACEGRK